jgi:hypothetical protein
VEVVKIGDSSVKPRTKKRRGLVLLQLLLVAGLLALVWFSFGQNVLGSREQLDVPERLGTLELTGTLGGSEAMAQIERLHGNNIEVMSAYIVEYAYGNERVIVWVGRAESSDAAAALTSKMIGGIGKGGSIFSNLQRLTIASQEVFQVDGPGGEHFFYNSGERDKQVVWLTVEAADALSILEQVVNTF